MKITVTKLDIKRGDQREHAFCPVARALRRVYSWKKIINVGHLYIQLNNKRYTTPDNVDQWISQFDEGRFVFPFTFEL